LPFTLDVCKDFCQRSFACLGRRSFSDFFLLSPEANRQLQTDIQAAVLFFTNISLNGESGYFDRSSTLKPLLHLWSLAVEEQFYLFAPLLLMMSQNLSRKRVTVLLTLTAALSLGLFLYHLPLDSSATFYLPQYRLWEFSLGGVISLVYFGKNNQRETLLRTLFGLGCLFLIFVLFFISKSFSSHGILALLLVACTSMLLVLEPRWLKHPFLKYVGLRSYALYLWHWPLLVLFRLYKGEFTTAEGICLVLVAAALAHLTYEFIEKKIYYSHRTLNSRSKIAIQIMVLILLLMAVPSTYNQTPILSTPWTTSSCLLSENQKNLVLWCQSDTRKRPSHLLIGDSHAASFYPGLVLESQEKNRWMVVAHQGCIPSVLIQYIGRKESDTCTRLSTVLFENLKDRTEIDFVLLVLANRALTDNDLQLTSLQKNPGATSKSHILYLGLADTVQRLKAMGKKVGIFKASPQISEIPSVCVKHSHSSQDEKRLRHCAITYKEHQDRTKEFNQIITQLKSDFKDLVVFDPASILCTGNLCDTVGSQGLLYDYTDHLSQTGAQLVAKGFLKEL